METLTPGSLSAVELLEILSLSKNATAIYTQKDIIIQTANDAMLALWVKDRALLESRC